ncbi:MAG: FAD-dependent oxidoreductase [Spirochaetales bacterium]|nr:FAD-dependent oxidoreductase [Spirochaetales bacterium]
MHDLIVIGGGPAGMVATVYAMRQRLNVLLVTETLGGKTEIRCEFPGIGETSVIRGRQLVDRFKNEIAYLRIAHRLERVSRVERRDSKQGHPSFTVRTAGGEELESRALIVASGCSFKPPQMPGAGRYLSKGIGYSALSYAHLFLDRTAVVIGSGRRAVRSALQLANSARQVYLLAPAAGAPPDGTPLTEALGDLENVTVLENCTIDGFNGDEYAREVVVGLPGGRQPQHVQADGFFVESEAEPCSEMVAGLVERDARGYILVDSRNLTSQAGIAAAGDVTTVGHEQVLVAVGEGAKAALSMLEHLLERR